MPRTPTRRPTLLALDVGATTGWAAFSATGRRVGSGVFKLKQRTIQGVRQPRAARYQSLRDFVQGLLSGPCEVSGLDGRTICDLVVERHRGSMRTVQTVESVMGYTAIAELCAFEQDVAVHHVNSQLIKILATGKGNASKDLMVKAAKKTWPKVRPLTHDQADALFLGLYALRNLL